MLLKRVISGGQTGADQQGLIEGRALGLETGGWVPKGWKTEAGAAPWLAEFGCREHPSPKYPPRTYANVKDSEATLWFGEVGSAGHRCTYNAALQYLRAWYANPNADTMKLIAELHEVINVAGNRASNNPGVWRLVAAAFASLKQ